MSDFTFNGVSAESLGLRIERYPGIPKPRKRMKTYTIPGRNGTLTQWDGSYENVTIRYECWFSARTKLDTIPSLSKEIADWLLMAPGAARLEDTYDPAYFRLASFSGAVDIENILNRYGRVTLEFDCAPQMFLKSGERRREAPAFGDLLLNNPTHYAAAPIFEISTNGNLGGVVRVDDYDLNLLFGKVPPRTIFVDCDLREAWYVENGEVISCNQVVSSPNFPRLDPGIHVVTWSGVGIDSVAVIPRWWCL